MLIKIKGILRDPKNPEEPNFIDRFLEKTILIFIPWFIKPNHLTTFRYVTIPFIFLLLVFGHHKSALILFFISAFSDALDGAMARTRNSITDWGKINDPMADKALIATAGALLITRYIGVPLLLVIVILEIIIISLSFYRNYGKRRIPSAKLPGKIKMVLQSSALFLLLFYSIVHIPLLVLAAQLILYLAVFFGIISIFVYNSL